MKEETYKLIIEIIKSPILSALIGGVTATILSPYIKWGVEKKKMRYDERKKVLNESRNILNLYGIPKYERNSQYLKLRQYFNKQLVIKIEKYGLLGDLEQQELVQLLLNEISRLEKKWKIF